MNPVPVTVGAPRTPLVNLLPPEIEMRRKQGAAQRLVLFALVAFLALLAGAWFYAFSARVSAESDLAAEQEKTPAKQSELAQFDYIPLVKTTLDNAVTARAWAGITDVTWATQLHSLLTATPSGISFTSLVLAGSTPSNPIALDGTPFQQPDLGQLSFAGNAASEADVVALQNAIDELPGFQNTSITTTAIAAVPDGSVAYWTFTGSTRVTANALSGRTETEQPLEATAPTADSKG